MFGSNPNFFIAMIDSKKIKRKVKQKIKSSKAFIHREWFIAFHLNIVEKIVLELCDVYTEANKQICLAMVWLHDYQKVIDFDREHKLGIEFKNDLRAMGLNNEEIATITGYICMLDSKSQIRKKPIEVQIVSSADGASHMVGPFFSIYWKENSGQSVGDILKENRRKLRLDWKRKIVLPEVRKKFQDRYNVLSEHFGILPSKYL